MKVNLPGAREGMYMETADSMFVETRNIAVKETMHSRPADCGK